MKSKVESVDSIGLNLNTTLQNLGSAFGAFIESSHQKERKTNQAAISNLGSAI